MLGRIVVSTSLSIVLVIVFSWGSGGILIIRSFLLDIFIIVDFLGSSCFGSCLALFGSWAG